MTTHEQLCKDLQELCNELLVRLKCNAYCDTNSEDFDIDDALIKRAEKKLAQPQTIDDTAPVLSTIRPISTPYHFYGHIDWDNLCLELCILGPVYDFINGVVTNDGTLVTGNGAFFLPGSHDVLAWDGATPGASIITLTVGTDGKATPVGICFTKKVALEEMRMGDLVASANGRAWKVEFKTPSAVETDSQYQQPEEQS